MTKWVMPSFLVSAISIIAITLNGKFGWDLRPDQLVASLAVSVNFVAVTIGADIAKMKRGERPNFNSTKLVTLLLATAAIGFSEYVGIDLDTEQVIYIAGACATFLTTKGIRDIIQTKGGSEYVPTQSNITSDPRV